MRTEATDFDLKLGRNGLNCSTDDYETSEIQLDSPLLQNQCKQIKAKNICNERERKLVSLSHKKEREKVSLKTQW